MVHRFKKNSVIAYRIGERGNYPLYVHPECVDTDFPGEGEAIFAADLELGGDDSLSFPGEYSGEWSDHSIDNTCCGGCGQWFNGDDRLAGVEAVVNKRYAYTVESTS